MSKLFKQKFDVRWSDLDANRHLANSAYVNFMSHTRMAYLMKNGFGYKDIQEKNIGPVIFHEHIHYFKEVLPSASVYVTLQLKGLSKNGMFFEFEHNMYNEEGVHHLYAELMGGMIDLSTRKLTALPEDMVDKTFNALSKTDDFQWLTKENTRKHNKVPKNRPDLFS